MDLTEVGDDAGELVDITDDGDDAPVVEQKVPRLSELDKAKIASKRQDWENGRLDKMLRLDEVKNTKSGYDLSFPLRTLRDGRQIDVEVINFWAEKVYSNLNEKQKQNCIFLKANFYGIIAKGRWFFDNVDTRIAPHLSSSTSKRFFMPISNHGHWILAVISLERQTVTFYDSLKGRNDHAEEFQVIQMWLNQICKLQGINPCIDFRSKRPILVPKQDGGTDCGVFVCMYLAYVSIRKILDFEQKDIPLLRLWISYNISEKYL